MKPTLAHAHAFLKLIQDHGLVAGFGKPIPGQMCIEAAWCYVLQLPHSDDPKCVGKEIRELKIELNDKDWSTPQARAKGLARFGLAQIGSDTLDQKAFKDLFWFRCGTQLQPLIWRFLALKENAEKRNALALALENGKSLEECRTLCRNYAYAYDYGYAYGYAYAYAYGYGYGYGYNYGYTKDQWLTKVAELAVQCLVELKSPGCEWLDLVPAPTL